MQVINRIDLEINQKDVFRSEMFQFPKRAIKISRKTLKQWLSALTALTKTGLSVKPCFNLNE